MGLTLAGWYAGSDLAGSGFLGDGLTSFSEGLDAFADTMTDWFSADGSGDGSGDGGFSDGGGDGEGDGGGGGD